MLEAYEHEEANAQSEQYIHSKPTEPLGVCSQCLIGLFEVLDGRRGGVCVHRRVTPRIQTAAHGAEANRMGCLLLRLQHGFAGARHASHQL